MAKTKKVFTFQTGLNKILIVVFFSFFNSCKPFYNAIYKKPELVDDKASKPVKNLHKQLFYLSKKGFAIGHQDATSYGIGWIHADFPNTIKSDVNDMVEDFPAVYGFDISGIELGNANNIDGVPFVAMRNLIVDAYSKGGIITISWHADNPKTNGSSWDTTPVVKEIIGEGLLVGKYDEWLSKVAVFLKSITYKDKEIPIIFRPFHEMNGGWFWWGKSHCNAIEYVQLWRNTVYSLRDKYNVHNLMYVYAPNKLNPNDNYMDYYPGDAFVDVLGVDIYDFQNPVDYAIALSNDLKLVKSIADEKRKLYALTETGIHSSNSINWFTQELGPDQNWFTKVVYPNVENSGISWILFWRNGNGGEQYMPNKGHKSESDFKEFKKLPKVLFLKDINKFKP